MNKPIDRFNNDKELMQCLREWQERLFLRDWNIKGWLVDGEEIPDLAGESDIQHENNRGTIKIRKRDQLPDGIEKQPHELVLVHELLHFSIMMVDQLHATVEGVHFNIITHRLIEQMAKSLIMAKYDLKYEWFYTFEEE